jgi:hypothetical protein
MASAISHSIGFLRNKNAALPVRVQKSPLPLSGLKKNRFHRIPTQIALWAVFMWGRVQATPAWTIW